MSPVLLKSVTEYRHVLLLLFFTPLDEKWRKGKQKITNRSKINPIAFHILLKTNFPTFYNRNLQSSAAADVGTCLKPPGRVSYRPKWSNLTRYLLYSHSPSPSTTTNILSATTSLHFLDSLVVALGEFINWLHPLPLFLQHLNNKHRVFYLVYRKLNLRSSTTKVHGINLFSNDTQQQ